MNKVYKYLLAIAALAAAGFGIYEYTAPDKYQYWKELIAKDPKPDGVSEQEYREKLRAGYCWRDRKFYTPEELHRKAMVSFAERMLGVTIILQNSSITTLAGNSYVDCQKNVNSCSVWLIPKNYTNRQWDNLFLSAKKSTDYVLLEEYPKKQIKQSIDLEKYFIQYGNKGFTLVATGAEGGESVYGSDCCKVLSRKDVEPIIKNRHLITFAEIFPEKYIPSSIKIENYGIGNFYLNSREVIPSLSYSNKEGKVSHEADYSELLLMNNCGDVLWKPYYHLSLY